MQMIKGKICMSPPAYKADCPRQTPAIVPRKQSALSRQINWKRATKDASLPPPGAQRILSDGRTSRIDSIISPLSLSLASLSRSLSCQETRQDRYARTHNLFVPRAAPRGRSPPVDAQVAPSRPDPADVTPFIPCRHGDGPLHRSSLSGKTNGPTMKSQH